MSKAFTLYPYQEQSVSRIVDMFGSRQDRVLLVMATGTGKTVVFATVLKRILRPGEKALVIAHRGELLEQAGDKIRRIAGLESCLEKAESHALESPAPVVLGSIQTLSRDSRLNAFPEDYFSVIVVDEAHHAMSDSYQKVLGHFRKAKILGVTATPDRMDKRRIEDYFGEPVFQYTLKDGISEEHLAPLRARMIPVQLDISKVRIQNGDYSERDLGDALDPYLVKIARKMKKYCADRKTLIFLPLVETAERFSGILNSNGFKSVSISGKTPKAQRDKVYLDLKRGRINAICNAMVLTEGFDEDTVDCIVCLRPTKSRSLFMQIVGRGTRYRKDKEYCLVLDFLWLTKQHMCHPSCLVSPDDEIAGKIDELIAKGQLVDLLEAEEQQEEDRKEARKKKLMEELERRAEEEARQSFEEAERLVDPLLFAFSVSSDELATYKAYWPWEKEAPTEKQLDLLKKRGINTNRITTRGQASALLKELFKRMDDGLSTPRQIRFLEKMGHRNVSQWTFERAKEESDTIMGMPTDSQISALWRWRYGVPWEMTAEEARSVLDALAQNGWKRPPEYPEGWRPERIGKILSTRPLSKNERSLLERKGFRPSDSWNYGDGARIISDLAQNRWDMTAYPNPGSYVPVRVRNLGG